MPAEDGKKRTIRPSLTRGTAASQNRIKSKRNALKKEKDQVLIERRPESSLGGSLEALSSLLSDDDGEISSDPTVLTRYHSKIIQKATNLSSRTIKLLHMHFTRVLEIEDLALAQSYNFREMSKRKAVYARDTGFSSFCAALQVMSKSGSTGEKLQLLFQCYAQEVEGRITLLELRQLVETHVTPPDDVDDPRYHQRLYTWLKKQFGVYVKKGDGTTKPGAPNSLDFSQFSGLLNSHPDMLSRLHLDLNQLALSLVAASWQDEQDVPLIKDNTTSLGDGQGAADVAAAIAARSKQGRSFVAMQGKDHEWEKEQELELQRQLALELDLGEALEDENQSSNKDGATGGPGGLEAGAGSGSADEASGPTKTRGQARRRTKRGRARRSTRRARRSLVIASSKEREMERSRERERIREGGDVLQEEDEEPGEAASSQLLMGHLISLPASPSGTDSRSASGSPRSKSHSLSPGGPPGTRTLSRSTSGPRRGMQQDRRSRVSTTTTGSGRGHRRSTSRGGGKRATQGKGSRVGRSAAAATAGTSSVGMSPADTTIEEDEQGASGSRDKTDYQSYRFSKIAPGSGGAAPSESAVGLSRPSMQVGRKPRGQGKDGGAYPI